MFRISALVMILSFGLSATKADANNDYPMIQCSSVQKTNPSNVINGNYFTEYAYRVFRVFETSNSGIFLVQDGVYDANTGYFTSIEEWHAGKKIAGDLTTYRNIRSPKKYLSIRKGAKELRAISSSSYHFADAEYKCEDDYPYGKN